MQLVKHDEKFLEDEVKPRTTEEMRERAQRQLDGMTVNRDALASDVIYLCAVVDRLTAQLNEEKSKGKDKNPFAFGSIFGA